MKRLLYIVPMILILAFSILVNLAAVSLAANQAGWSDGLKWAVGLGTFLIISCSIFALWKWYQKGLPAEVKAQKMGWKDLGINFLFYLLGRLVAVVGTLANNAYTGQEMSANDQAIHKLVENLGGGFPFYAVYFLITIAILGPIMEELAFRGFMVQFFFKKGPHWLAAAVTSAVFSFLHLGENPNIVEFSMYFAMGLVMYLAYARRGNLKDSILLHILNNAPIALLLGVMYLG